MLSSVTLEEIFHRRRGSGGLDGAQLVLLLVQRIKLGIDFSPQRAHSFRAAVADQIGNRPIVIRRSHPWTT